MTLLTVGCHSLCRGASPCVGMALLVSGCPSEREAARRFCIPTKPVLRSMPALGIGAARSVPRKRYGAAAEPRIARPDSAAGEACSAVRKRPNKNPLSRLGDRLRSFAKHFWHLEVAVHKFVGYFFYVGDIKTGNDVVFAKLFCFG